ncbi:MAG TPA: glycosyltransferase family A protein [Actinomycetota bacterium]|nr:glycosyltransferase family A protein [Actinomycetota bacterium]
MVRCSVVIPAYNAERYLASAIRSALAQTFTGTEVIVVDDGSTDGTAEVIDSFGDRVFAIHQPNAGPSVARNVGMKAASGEYIAFLDSDDMWMPRRLEQMVGRLDADKNLGFVTSDAYLINEERPTSLRYYGTLVDPTPFNSEDLGYWIVRQNFIFTGVVVRTELFDRHGTFMPNILAEDWDLWTRFILEGSGVGLVDSPLGYYRIRRAGLTCSDEFDAHREAALFRNLHDPKVLSIPGLGRDLFLPLAREALLSRNLDEARFCLQATAHDRTISRPRRVLAGCMAAFPAAAAISADLQAQREARRASRTFVLVSGALRDSDGRAYRPDPYFEGWVESDGRSAPLSGWAVGRRREPVDLLAVFVDGRFHGSVTPSVLRPDVAAHTGNPESVISGFCATEPAIRPEPEQKIQVIAISGHRYAELPMLDSPTQT